MCILTYMMKSILLGVNILVRMIMALGTHMGITTHLDMGTGMDMDNLEQVIGVR